MLTFSANKAILILCENILGILLDHICHKSTYNVRDLHNIDLQCL